MDARIVGRSESAATKRRSIRGGMTWSRHFSRRTDPINVRYSAQSRTLRERLAASAFDPTETSRLRLVGTIVPRWPVAKC